MTEAAKEAKREYQREWRQRNRDKIRAYNAKYWAERAEQRGVDPQKAPETAKREATATT